MKRPSYETHEPAAALKARLAEAFGIRLTLKPEERWRAWRGHDIHLDVYTPARERAAPVILVHGGGGNGRILQPFAEPLVAAGSPVMAPDLPGYGLTQVAPGWRPDYADWVDCVADLAAEVTKTHGRKPVLYGLSMGGFVALWAAQKTPSAGVIATTLIDLRDPEIVAVCAKKRWLGRFAAWGYRAIPWIMDAVPMRVKDLAPLSAMSTDSEINAILGRDPLFGRRWVSGRFFRTAHTYTPPDASMRLDCPLLLAHPGADAWTPARLSESVFARLPDEKDYVKLSNGAHAPFEAPAYDELNAAVLEFLTRVNLEPSLGLRST
jgi:pimeloyl-ACP methyl ester carboxylesterase